MSEDAVSNRQSHAPVEGECTSGAGSAFYELAVGDQIYLLATDEIFDDI